MSAARLSPAPDGPRGEDGFDVPPRESAADLGDDEAEDIGAGPPALRASVRLDDPRWAMKDVLAITDRALAAIAAGPHAPEEPTSLDLLFSGDNDLARLNAQFRKKAMPTNVLSFPSGDAPDAEGHRFLGSIALAFDTCAREADASNTLFAHHATHLIVHGVLHLLGFDHEDDAEAEVMERAEVEILARLGIADPYEGK